MKLLTLDPAASTGWAFFEWDPRRNENHRWSAIECGAFKLVGDSEIEKCQLFRAKLRELRAKYHPDFVVFEMALKIAPRFQKKDSRNLFSDGGVDLDTILSMVDRMKAALARGGASDPEARRLKNEIFGEDTTINAATIAMLNYQSGYAQATIDGMGLPFEIVRSQTWQTVLDKRFKGSTKERVRQACDHFNIVGKNEDARDAAMMLVWAVLKSKPLAQHIYEMGRSAA